MTRRNGTAIRTGRATALRFFSLLLLGLTCGMVAAAQAPSGGQADPADGSEPHWARSDRDRLEQDVRMLASDAMRGRGLGSAGLRNAILQVAQRFQSLGLLPAEPESQGQEILTAAHPLAGYLQEFHAHGHPASANVIGLLPGRDPRDPRAVLVGAHIDHLGRDEDLTGDTIYNGADDNASGVAALLEIARMLAAAELEDRDRTVIFAVFSGEESGLLGSRYYAEHPVVAHEDVIAMLNLDSVGRLDDDRLYVFGTGTARELASILEGLNNAFGFDLILRDDAMGGSDHVSFHAHGVPAVHFFTGPHADYSKVTDEADRIAYAGLAQVTDYVAELARYLRYRGRALTFVEPSRAETEKIERMHSGGERKVSLGFMPDFTMQSGGVKVGQVFPGGCAARAGIEPGDVITAIDEEPIESLVDYSTILRQHAPGDRVTVTLRRGSQTLRVDAEMQERR